MMTADLGACEWFLWDLRRSNLLDRSQLDQVVGAFLEKNPRAEPPELAQYLVNQSILTQFQADRLLQGKTQGFVLGPYVLMDVLGNGSMGTVYRAHSKNDNNWYAVKVLPRRSMWNVRLAKRKARLFEQCAHPAVVPFVDVGTSGGMHYLAWPLIEGENLHNLVQREGRIRPNIAAKYAWHVAQGLEVVHQQGLFHGLLKPSNLMVGKDEQVRILDLGIGSLLAETEGESLVDTMSTANSVASGLDCASPESIMDPTNLTPFGDQYSLGCSLYYFLTGNYPFPDGTAAEKMIAQQTRQPAPVQQLAPEVPEALAAVVAKLLQKSPGDRFGSTNELVEALRPLALASLRNTTLPGRPLQPRPLPAEALRPLAPKPEPVQAAALKRPETPPAPPLVPGNQAPQLPTRQSLRGPTGPPPRQPAQPPAPQPPRPTVAQPPRPAAPVQQPAPDMFEEPRHSWEDRVGPVGIAASALVVCLLAWLATWKFF